MIKSYEKIPWIVDEHGKASTHYRVKIVVLWGVDGRDETWGQNFGSSKREKGEASICR